MIPSTDAARTLGRVSTDPGVTSDGQDEHNRWFEALLSKLRRKPHGRRSEEWNRVVEEAPILDNLAPGELAELMWDAEPATEDDVPWRFPVRTPLEETR